MRLFGKFVAVVSPVILLAVAPTVVEAASCSALKAELARATSGGGGGALAALERRALANGCRASARFGRPRVCAGIDAQIQSMRGGGGNSRRARQLQREVARACSGQQQAERPTRQERRQARAAQPAQQNGPVTRQIRAPANDVIIGSRRQEAATRRARAGGGFFASLFGGVAEPVIVRQPGVERVVPEAVYRAERQRELQNRQREASRPRNRSSGGSSTADPQAAAAREAQRHWRPNAPKGGSFKTWCVRLCDGFYFPISENTSSNSFPQDLAMCVNQCPAVDVSLYAHKTDRPPERMISAITGEPYVDLPTAFAYRKTFNGSCGCGSARSPSEVLEASSQPADAGGTIEVAGFSASTQSSDRLPSAVARIKAKLEPTAGSDSVTLSSATAYRPPAQFDVGADAAIAAAAAQATGDPTAMQLASKSAEAAFVADAGDAGAGGLVPESTIAAGVQSETGEPMLLMPPKPDPAGEDAAAAPPTDIEESLRFREVGPKFYAARATAVLAPSPGLARAQ